MARPALPFFDFLLERFGSGDGETRRAFGRHVHWGYWSDPAAADGTTADFEEAAERMCRLVCDAGQVRDGGHVLDAGCGFGGTLASLNERFRGVRLAGINIDERQLAHARGQVVPRADNTVTFLQADACRLPFAPATFDSVLAVETAFHYASRDQFFREARRVLRPGGKLALSDFVPRPWLQPLTRVGYRLARPVVSAGYAEVDNACSVEDYRALANACGFAAPHVQDVTVHTRPTYPVLRRVVGRSGPWPVRAVTALADWVSVAGIIRYAVLTFGAT